MNQYDNKWEQRESVEEIMTDETKAESLETLEVKLYAGKQLVETSTNRDLWVKIMEAIVIYGKRTHQPRNTHDQKQAAGRQA